MSDALRLIRKRAGDRCEYCRLPDSVEPIEQFHVEHIVARQHGGESVAANLAWACPLCNRCKGPNLSAIDPESGEVVQLFNPRLADWTAHFAMVGAQIQGLTAVGRATVALLKMNAPRSLERRSEVVRRDQL